ncbi:MAG: hypothetical protein OXH09_17020 [Gammaproteobacteria bacterium]|nr:hypothetical protein [Gammaproteobacteria bacterium]
MGGWIGRRAGALYRITTMWRTSVWVGLTGMTASAGCFTAMTLQSAPLVRALGQVELLLLSSFRCWCSGNTCASPRLPVPP